MLELILLLAVIVCSLIVYFKEKKPVFLTWFLLPILIFALIIKAFFLEAVKVSSNSMLPTIEVGDLIVANKSAYDIRLPILNKKIAQVAQPRRGDLLVFRWPNKPEALDVKRLIGMPGDNIEYRGKILFINDVKVSTHYVGGYEADGDSTEYLIFREDIHSGENIKEIQSSMLLDYAHYLSTGGDASWQVPDNHYFVLGDNRDKSADSRTLGFLPKENVVSKALFVLFHWSNNEGGNDIKWARIGTDVTPQLPIEDEHPEEGEHGGEGELREK